MIFIQFYNTPFCSARQWVTDNPNYKPGNNVTESRFSYGEWVNEIASGASKDAKLYISLPGGPAAAGAGSYITPAEASSLISAFHCQEKFGGVAIWEATYAENNNATEGKPFYALIKEALTAQSGNSSGGVCDPVSVLAVLDQSDG